MLFTNDSKLAHSVKIEYIIFILAANNNHMRKITSGFILLLTVLIFQSCYKEQIYDENPFLIKKRVLDYEDLKLQNPSLFTGDTVRIEALASGDSLNFSWSADNGVLLATGAVAKFTSDIPGNYGISCTITDKYGNSDTKEVSILVAAEMVFSELNITEPIIPVNFETVLRASASGEGLSYQWVCDGSSIQAAGDSAIFKSDAAGKYTVQCVVTDMFGIQKEKSIEVEVVNGFVYKAVTANPQEVKAGDYSEVQACVLGGDNCTYSWKSFPQGTIVGSGPKVLFTICHADLFEVSCMVTDNNGNSVTQSVFINVIN